MPYPNEHATAQALLHTSAAKREFDGEVLPRAKMPDDERPEFFSPNRKGRTPKYIIAIDGSQVSCTPEKAYPGAEAALIQIAAVVINPGDILTASRGKIPSPRVFRDVEDACAVDTVIPGTNVAGKDADARTPYTYFRKVIQRTLDKTLTKGHETLAETLSYLVKTSKQQGKNQCPVYDCKKKFNIHIQLQSGKCPCDLKNPLHVADSIRFKERFGEERVEPRLFSEVRSVIELLSLINIIRFFDTDDRRSLFRDIAFVLDGPLAAFGTPAWLMRPIRQEIQRISGQVGDPTQAAPLVVGIEKSGQFVEHFKILDHDNQIPRSRAFIPDTVYIHKHIALRPSDAEPYGKTTYFGRKILYKTKIGSLIVLNIAMSDSQSEDLSDVSEQVFPRLGEALDMMDVLATHLYPDAFWPIVRAHAHAAIPLQQGKDILMAILTRTGT